jgi:hypothetical protein
MSSDQPLSEGLPVPNTLQRYESWKKQKNEERWRSGISYHPAKAARVGSSPFPNPLG